MKSVVWLVRTIRQILDDKALAEAADFREGFKVFAQLLLVGVGARVT